MAVDDSRFSHITVTADDEDDVVIEAGARTSRPVVPVPSPAQGPVECEAALEAHEERVGEFEAATEPVAEEGVPSHKKKDEGFRETTMDDLKSEPMPFAQKIVIAFAAIGVLAIVAWCLFMR